MATGRIKVLAGHIGQIKLTPQNHANVSIRLRGQNAFDDWQFARVINCMGPCFNLAHLNDALIKQLLKAGEITPDGLGLGLEMGNGYEVQHANGYSNK